MARASTPKAAKGKAKLDIISSEKDRLSKLFANIAADKRIMADKLIDRAAFMSATLENYELIINTEGEIIKMEQGSYSIDRDHPAAKAYNTMIKNYHLVIKQLIEMLPEKPANEEFDALKSFMRGKNEQKDDSGYNEG